MQNVYLQLTNTLSVTTLHKKEQGEVLPSLHNLDYNYAYDLLGQLVTRELCLVKCP